MKKERNETKIKNRIVLYYFYGLLVLQPIL